MGGNLHYIGIERSPLQQTDLVKALNQWPELRNVSEELLFRWPDPIPGCHRRYFDDWGVTFDFWWGEAAKVLEDLASHRRAWVDAWYLDGFAPARERGPWQQSIYKLMAELSHSNATASTFTVAAHVKKGLTEAGFSVKKTPGYGSKREVLKATLISAAVSSPKLTPWDIHSKSAFFDKAIVVGAGLAGAHIAYALATRGVQVIVLESSVCASKGSSNLQGITYTRLSQANNPISDFSIASFCYATDFYSKLLSDGKLHDGLDIGLGGYIQLEGNVEKLKYFSTVLKHAPSFAKILSAEEIEHVIGEKPRCGGIHFLRGGWLDPRAVCHALLKHPLISLKEHCGTVSIEALKNNRWEAFDKSKNRLAEASVAVLATAYQIKSSAELSWLPLNIIRGQTTHLPTTEILANLPIALCDRGYIPPERRGIHCLGASYLPGDQCMDQREAEHTSNLKMAHTALPNLNLVAPKHGWGGHVALRCNSTDYLPIIGLAPDANNFKHHYGELRHDRKRVLDRPAPIFDGLALLGGFGSRGLTATPLAAQILVDQLTGTPPTVLRNLHRAVSPARFLERSLSRGKM